jgi:hypothetical protein
MAKDKDRALNPAAAHHKAEKQKALKKGKAQLQAQRTEKLARRNPERLQRQVDEFKALEASGQLKPREKTILEALERDVRAIRKARESLGDKAPQFPTRRGPEAVRIEDERNGNVLGKRRRDGERTHPHHRGEERAPSSGSDTDEGVRRIPMPKDTPPPIPRHHHHHRHRGTNANTEPLGRERPDLALLPSKPAPAPATQVTYAAAPQVRDLVRDAARRFVPNAVRAKQLVATGAGGRLAEPEELDVLEKEGYVLGDAAAGGGGGGGGSGGGGEVEGDGGAEGEVEARRRRLAEEEARFDAELRQVQVQIEEVDDEEKDL